MLVDLFYIYICETIVVSKSLIFISSWDNCGSSINAEWVPWKKQKADYIVDISANRMGMLLYAYQVSVFEQVFLKVKVKFPTLECAP